MVIRMHRRVFRLCTAGTILACGLLTMAITSSKPPRSINGCGASIEASMLIATSRTP